MMPTATCFAAGTLIFTDFGEVAIEQLTIGDKVLTSSGLAPIRWIGRRAINFQSNSDIPDPHNWPVRITQNALGEYLPKIDLIVSRGHAIFAHGKIVTAGALLGHPGINLLETVDQITYYHLEFDRWEILLANGLPAESYVDVGNRKHFDNYDEWRLKTECEIDKITFATPLPA